MIAMTTLVTLATYIHAHFKCTLMYIRTVHTYSTYKQYIHKIVGLHEYYEVTEYALSDDPIPAIKTGQYLLPPEQ